SSRFAKGHRWGYFPSFSAAWRLSEEAFMENTRDWLTSLKIRGSWGLLGNQDALDDYYPSITTYNVNATYPFGGNLNTGYYQGSYKLQSISWEKSRTWGVGFDATFLNKLSVSFDYYDRKTTDIIMEVPVPQEFALGAYYDNVGAMVNRGTEVVISYNDKWGAWSFGATGNFSYNKNKLLDLGAGVSSMTDPNNGNKIRKIGSPINSYYMYVADGFFDSDADAQAWMDKYAGQEAFPFGTFQFQGGDLIYKDVNGDGKITSDDRKVVGSSDPSWTFGLNLTAGWKGFDLSVAFQGAAGGHLLLSKEAAGYFNGDASHPANVWLDAWTPENKNATMPHIYYSANSPSDMSTCVSTFWLQNTTYLRLKNLQFGYTFSKKSKWMQRVGLDNLRIYYSAENLFTIHNMLVNTDPETTVERTSNYPLLKTHSFGLNVTF
ncbi:MAG: SusC/RagA family TonB-linked outer membrane protein, partial [Prevotellaceae bacterium]|nr:SusC/RagA family TonB-linked outer membrane protein [Prevotellaceae bacterium]